MTFALWHANYPINSDHSGFTFVCIADKAAIRKNAVNTQNLKIPL